MLLGARGDVGWEGAELACVKERGLDKTLTCGVGEEDDNGWVGREWDGTDEEWAKTRGEERMTERRGEELLRSMFNEPVNHKLIMSKQKEKEKYQAEEPREKFEN